ncbi:hypothetical protein EDD18DRAFT_1112807 [Armillaria luteobubalina]|uniref:Uncharacterized protein n=1 Tax=Armillaria luteobubalina TaxID=153913 RepID=A0AA39PD09_9AGAR|nr:hypothetical protein EDD18DRAFT_1112807 [Armillaria luteobubalina]
MDLATTLSLHSLQNRGLQGNQSEFGRQGRVEVNDQTKFTGDTGPDTAPCRMCLNPSVTDCIRVLTRKITGSIRAESELPWPTPSAEQPRKNKETVFLRSQAHLTRIYGSEQEWEGTARLRLGRHEPVYIKDLGSWHQSGRRGAGHRVFLDPSSILITYLIPTHDVFRLVEGGLGTAFEMKFLQQNTRSPRVAFVSGLQHTKERDDVQGKMAWRKSEYTQAGQNVASIGHNSHSNKETIGKGERCSRFGEVNNTIFGKFNAQGRASGEAVESLKYKNRSRTDVSLPMTAQLYVLEASAHAYEVKLDQGRRKIRHGSASVLVWNVWRERADSNVSTIMSRCWEFDPTLTLTIRWHKRGNALPENAAKEQASRRANAGWSYKSEEELLRMRTVRSHSLARASWVLSLNKHVLLVILSSEYWHKSNIIVDHNRGEDRATSRHLLLTRVKVQGGLLGSRDSADRYPVDVLISPQSYTHHEGHGEFCVRCHSRYDYTFPTKMKLPNEERTLTFLGNFLHADEVHENEDPEEFLLKPGPDFDEGERQERFRAREEEDNVKKRAHGPVPKTWMISRKHKEVSEPGTAENSLQDGSAKVLGHPAKRARNKKT